MTRKERMRRCWTGECAHVRCLEAKDWRASQATERKQSKRERFVASIGGPRLRTSNRSWMNRQEFRHDDDYDLAMPDDVEIWRDGLVRLPC